MDNNNYKSISAGFDNSMFTMPKEKVETKWFTPENINGEKGKGGMANYGRKGSPCVLFAPGETIVLADIKGSGTIRRIWATLFGRSPEALRGIKIEIYWDGAETPAVQAPFGDFFGHTLGSMVTFENACFSSPEGRSFVCYIPMPFHKSARVQIVNESIHGNGIYYEVDCTVGEKHSDEMLYFHSFWNRENMTTFRNDFRILPKINGKGRFLGTIIGVRQHPLMYDFWWGEGEVKVYLDGDTDYPTLCGTGTEDYIGSGWAQDKFINRYQGCPFMSDNKQSIGYNRFHIPDPIYFYSDISITTQVMGGVHYGKMLEIMDKDPNMRFMKAGNGSEYFTREELEADLNHILVIERFDDYCAVAYWYMDSAENGLPPISSVDERVKDLP